MLYFVCISPPSPNFNKGEFLKQISNTLNKYLKCHDNIVLAGDPNINLLDPSKDNSNHFYNLLDVFNLKNLVKEPTCFISDKGSLIDIILTNKPRSFRYCYRHQRFSQVSRYRVEA